MLEDMKVELRVTLVILLAINVFTYLEILL